MEITVNVPQLTDLARALEALALAIGQAGAPVGRGQTEGAATQAPTVQDAPPIAAPAQQIQPPQQAAPASAVPTAPASAVPTAPPAAPAAAVPQAPTAPAAVPTAAPSYTLDQLAVAATQLMDAGRRDQLVQLLQSFGVQALTMLPKEQYGAFATKLRELGAKL
ncbi:MAG: hypothetical protein K6T78_08160 [Alicyclobacillus sp.]|nr:hypothetical protein [Alicyclobacillus sp.]